MINLTLSPTRPGAGSPGMGAGGAPAPAFLGSQGNGTRFVYVVDRSGSMKGARFVAACEELKKSLNSLRADMSFHVIFYDFNEEEMPGTPLFPVTAENLSKATDWINTQQARGGTRPANAMLRAIELQPDTIWLLSDGAFPRSVCDDIAQANATKGICINTIAFQGREGEVFLKRIATENKGTYTFVPSSAPNPSGPSPGLLPGIAPSPKLATPEPTLKSP